MPFVQQTIDSVLMQQYASKEYIVIDGGSVDGTLEVIKAAQSGIAHWVSESDEGISDAFNKGLARATGDYLLFLNADDALAHAGVLAAVAQKIATSGFPTFLYGNCDVLDRDTGAVNYRASIEVSRINLLRGSMPPHPSLFTKRCYFEQFGNFNKQFKLAMDFEWFSRGCKAHPVVHAPLLVSNVRTGGLSTRNQARAVDEIVRALVMNGHIPPGWGEFKMRGYFLGRQYVRWALEKLGLYGAFASIRNQRALKPRQ